MSEAARRKQGGDAVRQLERVLAKLQRMDYFEILGVDRDAEPEEIRKHFYARSRKFHPDRYPQVRDPRFRRLVTQAYKLIAEAYNVLKVPKTRLAYRERLEADREANLRWRPNEEGKRGESESYDGGSGPGAKYYKLAQQALVARNLAAARNNIKLALTLEPNNEHFKALKAKIDAAG